MSAWTTWWEQAHEQAKEFATKAQELAIEASIKAKDLAKQASELNFDSVVTNNGQESVKGNIRHDNSSGFSGSNTLGAFGLPREPSGRTINDLDLMYITENIITMAYPIDFSVSSSPTTTGNDINLVSQYLRQRHGGHFMIWNVSEELYDYGKFDHQVLEYKFPGHPSPPLGLLFKICSSVESWLDADSNNVAVVHCLTGKGRTAALVACILAWMGEFSTASEALAYISDRRSIPIDYLTIPSQRRYIEYFNDILKSIRPKPEPLLLRRILFNTIPVFGDNGLGEVNEGLCPYVQLFKCGQLIATAAPLEAAMLVQNDERSNRKVPLKWVRASEGNVSFSVDCALQGDILLRCRHVDNNGSRTSVFRCAFHTGYITPGVLRLHRTDLDGASNDSRFDEDFFIDLIFAPIESHTVMEIEGDAHVVHHPDSTVPTDSGLTIDPASLDRYEETLHRDTEFWDAVSARHKRSNERQTRRFGDHLQERFSISDEVSNSSLPPPPLREESSTALADDVAEQRRKNAALSDEELIMKMANPEEIASVKSQDTLDADMEEFIKHLTTPSDTDAVIGAPMNGFSSMHAAVKDELDALEELERALGIDELNSISSTTKAQRAIDNDFEDDFLDLDDGEDSEKPAARAVPSALDDVNIEDLEKYLDSLT